MKWTALSVICLCLAAGTARAGIAPPEIPVIILSVWAFLSLTRVMGRDMPILEITFCVYVIQTVAAPWFSYNDPPSFPRYQMAIASGKYFQYSVPATCAFLLPLVIARSRLPFLTQILDYSAGSRVFSLGLVLTLLGFGFYAISSSVPESLRFVTFLGSELRYVGALYCYFSRHKQRRWVLFLVMGMTLVTALASAMFHQLLIWGAVLMSVVLAREFSKLRFSQRGVLLLAAFVIMVVLDSYKGSYREALRKSEDGSVITAIRTVASTESLEWDRIKEVGRVRLNQGWIISNVLGFIPSEQPFLGGESFWAAYLDALVPRFIREKRVAGGGRENFRRMTGLQISDNTSMGVGTLGEAYANFGPDGGIVAMFGFGIVFGGTYYLLCTRSKENVLILLWLPLIYSQTIKSETELAVVLNHLVKAIMFVGIAYPVLHQIVLGKHRRMSERGMPRREMSPVSAVPLKAR